MKTKLFIFAAFLSVFWCSAFSVDAALQYDINVELDWSGPDHTPYDLNVIVPDGFTYNTFGVCYAQNSNDCYHSSSYPPGYVADCHPALMFNGQGWLTDAYSDNTCWNWDNPGANYWDGNSTPPEEVNLDNQTASGTYRMWYYLPSDYFVDRLHEPLGPFLSRWWEYYNAYGPDFALNYPSICTDDPSVCAINDYEAFLLQEYYNYSFNFMDSIVCDQLEGDFGYDYCAELCSYFNSAYGYDICGMGEDPVVLATSLFPITPDSVQGLATITAGSDIIIRNTGPGAITTNSGYLLPDQAITVIAGNAATFDFTNYITQAWGGYIPEDFGAFITITGDECSTDSDCEALYDAEHRLPYCDLSVSPAVLTTPKSQCNLTTHVCEDKISLGVACECNYGSDCSTKYAGEQEVFCDTNNDLYSTTNDFTFKQLKADCNSYLDIWCPHSCNFGMSTCYSWCGKYQVRTGATFNCETLTHDGPVGSPTYPSNVQLGVTCDCNINDDCPPTHRSDQSCKEDPVGSGDLFIFRPGSVCDRSTTYFDGANWINNSTFLCPEVKTADLCECQSDSDCDYKYGGGQQTYYCNGNYIAQRKKTCHQGTCDDYVTSTPCQCAQNSDCYDALDVCSCDGSSSCSLYDAIPYCNVPENPYGIPFVPPGSTNPYYNTYHFEIGDFRCNWASNAPVP